MNHFFFFSYKYRFEKLNYIKGVSLLVFLAFLSFPTVSAQQIEEGWRWKKTFILQVNEHGQKHSVDGIHDQMAADVAKLQRTLESFVQECKIVIDPIRNLLKHDPSGHIAP